MPKLSKAVVPKFACIAADPPWSYGDGNVRGGADNHYPMMSLEEIKALPIEGLAAEKSHLYLWTTNNFMVEAHEVCRAWGFEPKTILTWKKVSNGIFMKPAARTCHWFSGATEHVIFGMRGNLSLLPAREETTLILDTKCRYSAKPDWFYDLCVRCSPGPRLELFARRERPGWSRWGNEVESNINLTQEKQDA